MEEPTVAERQVSEDRFPGDQLLLGAQAEEEARQHGRGRSRAAAHVREARRADERAGDAGRRRGRRDLRQRVGRDHLQGEARRGRHHLLLDLGGGAASIPSSCASTSAPWCRPATTTTRRSTRRYSPTARSASSRRASNARWSCRPISASTPQDSGPVRAHADRRRGRRVGVLPRRLHGAQVRHQPAARGGGRAGRARQTPTSSTRRCRTGTRATRTASAASTTSSPSAACARASNSRISWTQVETGSAITWKYPSCVLLRRQLGRRVLLGGAHQPPPAGRHRHQDDPHRQEHAQHHRQQGHLGRPLQQQLPRPGAGSRPRPTARATTRSATRC